MSENLMVSLRGKFRAMTGLVCLLGVMGLGLFVSSCCDDDTVGPANVIKCLVKTDFAVSMAPFTDTHGDVSLQGGRLLMVRTGDTEADAYATFAKSWSAFNLTGDLSLITTESRVSVAVQDSGTEIGYHVVLQNETQNGSQAGLFLFYNSRHGNEETPAEDVLIQYLFTPAADHVYAFRLDRSSAGEFALWLDGTAVGTAQDTRVTTFGRVWLNAGQDTSAGHGASLGDLTLCRSGV